MNRFQLRCISFATIHIIWIDGSYIQKVKIIYRIAPKHYS